MKKLIFTVYNESAEMRITWSQYSDSESLESITNDAALCGELLNDIQCIKPTTFQNLESAISVIENERPSWSVEKCAAYPFVKIEGKVLEIDLVDEDGDSVLGEGPKYFCANDSDYLRKEFAEADVPEWLV